MKKLLVVFSLSLVLLAACVGQRDEKQSFIDATVEATCLIFQAEDLFDPALEEQTKEIYASYGFDVEDEAAMEAIAAKYENDEDVQSAILAAIDECSAGFLEDLDASFADEDLEMMDEEVTAEEVIEAEMMDEEVVEEESPSAEEVIEAEMMEEEVMEEVTE